MDNQINFIVPKHLGQFFLVTNIQAHMRIIFKTVCKEFLIPFGAGFAAKEIFSHVIVNPHYFMIPFAKIFHRFTTNESS